MAKFSVSDDATEARDVRPIWPVQGVGGVITVEWLRGDSGGGGTSLAGNLEVERWELIHDYDNVELPLSGGEGAMTRFRVGDDFEFVCDVLLDMRPSKRGDPDNSFAGQPFLDGRLEGHASDGLQFYVSLVFQVGDPDIWENLPDRRSIALADVGEKTGLQYRCQRALLRQTRTADSSKGKPPDGCVRAIVRGHGSAPLERWIEDRQVGHGGLGFDPPEKKKG